MRYPTILLFGLLLCSIYPTSTASVPRQLGVIRVWKIGSPYNGELPQTAFSPSLQAEAEKLGYRIEVEALSSEGFANRLWKAIEQHDEPEVIAFNNYAVLVGAQTPLGRFEGIVGDPRVASSLVWVHESLDALQQPGWVMLIASARNYQAARALAQRSVSCNSTLDQVHGIEPDDLRLVKETLTSASQAYLTCNKSQLSGVSDKARMGDQCFLPNGFVDALKVCSVTGNQNLILASLISSFNSEKPLAPIKGAFPAFWRPAIDLGHQSLLAILRRSEGEWRLLAITDDPTNVHPELVPGMRRFDSLFPENGPGSEPDLKPAQLITPDGLSLSPAPGQRFGNFVWQPSSSKDVVGQVAEFVVTGDRDLTRLFFLSRSDSQLSAGLLWGLQWRWRVWSVAKDGTVAFSEQRSTKKTWK